MAVFYVLPVRSVVLERWSQFWQTLFPGLPLPACDPEVLLESVEAMVQAQHETYVVFREDLPMDRDIVGALIDGYGASEADRVIEVHFAGPHRPIPVRLQASLVPCSSESQLGCYNAHSESATASPTL